MSRVTGKKLRDAVRYYLGQGGGADETQQDAQLFGVQFDQSNDPKMFFVLPENWDIIRAFCALQTQWRRDAQGQLCGLDYVGVEVALRYSDIPIKAVFQGLQVMESEVLIGANK